MENKRPATLKELIRDRDYLDFNNADNRALRKAMGELAQEGIIFVSVGDYQYKRIELCTSEEIQAYLWLMIKQATTTFTNRVNPIKKYMRQEHLDYLYDNLIKQLESGDTNEL